MTVSGSHQPLRSASDHERSRVELEERLQSSTSLAEMAELHLALGDMARDWFLEGLQALRHFQSALRLGARPPQCFGRARSVYRQIGRLSLVERLLRLELESTREETDRASLLRELGDVLMDEGCREDAAQSYEAAVAAGEPAAFLLEDAEVLEDEWPVRVGRLLQQAEAAGDTFEKTETLLRAAGIASAFSPTEAQQLRRRAYESDPLNERAAASFEGLLVEAGRVDELVEVQSRLLGADVAGERPAGALEFGFGVRWAYRERADLAAPLLVSAVRADVNCRPAVAYLVRLSRTDCSVDEVLVALAEELSDRFSSAQGTGPAAGGGLSYLLASAALVAARDVNNIVTTRTLRERLSRVDRNHPALGQLVDRPTAARD